MALLDYNEITVGKIITVNGEHYKVIDNQVSRKQQRKPQNTTKLKHLKSGKVMQMVFHVSESAEQADLEKKPILFIYQNRGEYWFHPVGKPSERFSLTADELGDERMYLKPGTEISSLMIEDERIGIELPIKIDLKVTEAPPGTKGNTAQGGSKQVVLESGATISAPLFINVGDVIRINTSTGEYTERVEKS